MCESSATKILFSRSQPIAVPGFLIFVIEPLGGPQVNLASTSADDLGFEATEHLDPGGGQGSDVGCPCPAWRPGIYVVSQGSDVGASCECTSLD